MKIAHKRSCNRSFAEKDPTCPGYNPTLAVQTAPKGGPQPEKPRLWPEGQRFLTADEAAEYLNIPWLSFLNLARANTFATFDWSERPAGSRGHVRLQDSTRFDRESLDAWVTTRRLPPEVVPDRIDSIAGLGAQSESELVRQRLLDSTDDSIRNLSLERVERDHIVRVMDSVSGNKRVAARILGISRRALYRKLALHDLDETFWTIRLGSRQ